MRRILKNKKNTTGKNFQFPHRCPKSYRYWKKIIFFSAEFIQQEKKSLKKKISESKLPIKIIHRKHRKLRKNPALFAH